MLVYSALVKMCMKKRDSICQVARSRKDLPSRADRSPLSQRRSARSRDQHTFTLDIDPYTIKGKPDIRDPCKDHFSGHKQVNGCCFDLQDISLQLDSTRCCRKCNHHPLPPECRLPPRHSWNCQATHILLSAHRSSFTRSRTGSATWMVTRSVGWSM